MPDFAVSKELKDSILSFSSRDVIFDYYAPPEYRPSHKYDIFMFGAILYEMITFSKFKIDRFNGLVRDTGIFDDLIHQCTDEAADQRPNHDGVFRNVRLILLSLISDPSRKTALEELEYLAFYPFCSEELHNLVNKK